MVVENSTHHCMDTYVQHSHQSKYVGDWEREIPQSITKRFEGELDINITHISKPGVYGGRIHQHGPPIAHVLVAGSWELHFFLSRSHLADAFSWNPENSLCRWLNCEVADLLYGAPSWPSSSLLPTCYRNGSTTESHNSKALFHG